MTPSDEEFLRKTSWLSAFPPTTADTILDYCQIREFAHRERVHKKGEKSEGLYGIITGGIRYSTVTASGYEVSFAIAAPGEWTGDLSSMGTSERTHDAYAIGALRVALLSMDAMEKLTADDQYFYPIRIENLCTMMRWNFYEIDKILSSSPEQLLAWRIYDLFFETRGGHEIPFTQEELAALIGVSRQSVNKILRKWSRRGIVDVRYGKLSILDFQHLERIAFN